MCPAAALLAAVALVSGDDKPDFAPVFIPVVVRGYVAVMENDVATVQEVVAVGKAKGFDKVLLGEIGDHTVHLPGMKHPLSFRLVWELLKEFAEPRLEFA